MRKFSTTSAALIRNFKHPKLRAPVLPSHKNLKVPNDHPLWQFFHNKQYMRPFDQLENNGRAWTVQELRRKSFEDLHTIWYKCLIERNKLLRESQIFQTWSESSRDRYKELSLEIKETMWRIRHVLSERDHSWQNAVDYYKNHEDKLYKEFEQRYLTADESQDLAMEGQLERFQFAFYGLKPLLEGVKPSPLAIYGMKRIALMKLKRFQSDNESITDVRDINEAYILFSAEHSPEGILDAIKSIEEYRQAREPVSTDPDVELEVFETLIPKV